MEPLFGQLRNLFSFSIELKSGFMTCVLSMKANEGDGTHAVRLRQV